MAFSIRLDRVLGRRLRLLSSQRVELAARALSEQSGGLEEAVHTARKRIKEARAVLRLERAFLGEAGYRRFNDSLRDVARPLADARDAAAMVTTLALFPQAQRLSATRDHLLRFCQVEYQKMLPIVPELSARAHSIARKMARRSLVPKVRRHELGLFAAGLEGSYRAGRRALKRARSRPDFENRHELRKRIKDLRYQFELLRPLSPEEMKRSEDAAHRLTDLLGEDHDLAVLGERLQGNLAAREILEIETRRAVRWKEALPLAEQLYAQRPKVFVARMKRAFVKARKR
jgi:CHAD domain-containing protein